MQCKQSETCSGFKLLAVGAVLVFAGCGARAQASDTRNGPAEAKTAQPMKAETVKLGTARLESSLRLPAELIADQRVDVHAKVNGYVKRLGGDIGDAVRKGDVLVQIEAPEIEAQLAAAKARWTSLEALHASSKASHERTVRTSAIEGAVSPDAVDRAKARDEADGAQAAAAKATYEELRAMKAYLVIRAPFDGIITERNVEIGSYVGPSSKAAQMPLMVVQSVDTMRLVIAIPEAHVGHVRVGDAVQFSVSSLPGRTFSARVARRAGTLDPGLRAERIEADFKNSDRSLLPNMVADARVVLASAGGTLVVPRSAVVETSMGRFVVRVQDGKATRVPVTRGLVGSTGVEVFGNLQAGDLIVAKANEGMQDGMAVVPAEAG